MKYLFILLITFSTNLIADPSVVKDKYGRYSVIQPQGNYDNDTSNQNDFYKDRYDSDPRVDIVTPSGYITGTGRVRSDGTIINEQTGRSIGRKK